jgi:hypothetical protein
MFVAHIDAAVCVEINDPDVIERVTGPKGDEWRSQMYNLHTKEDVIQHLAYNALVNGVGHASKLEGWADLPEGAATMSVRECDPVGVFPEEAVA